MTDSSAKAHGSAAFEAVARRIAGLTDIRQIRAELRQLWNARGVADIATVELALFETMAPAEVGRHLKRLDRAIRALDRA